MFKRIVFLTALFILFLLTVSVAFAQEKSVVVQRRDADMTINKDGSVHIVETWLVDFQGGPFRFAFRAIPFNKISSLVFEGVSENGKEYLRAASETPNTYSVEAGGGERIITWYFEPTTNATRTFELRYTITDALRIYGGGDQFWWKFIEQDRPYPIKATRVTLHLPGTFPTQELLAATYTDGREHSDAKILDGSTIEFTGGPIPAHTEWEIRAQFPHGAVTQPVQAWQAAEDQRELKLEAQARAIEQFNFYSLFATLLLIIGGGLALLLMWFVRGRDQAVALPAEFLNAPPDDLTPALAGTLIDEEANVRDVLATLIDWAQRGIIKIRALPQGAQTATTDDDYAYEKIGTDAPALQYQYERELMQRLWAGETSRNMGYIREKFTASLNTMFDSLYNELVRRGYFLSCPDRVRAQFYRLGWLLLVLLCPGAFLFQLYAGIAFSPDLAFSFGALLPWIVLFILAGAVMVLARFMPRKTPQGAQAAARWNAFKRYLEHIEKYTNVADAQEQFERYLPYAVAFGIDKAWVEKFAQVDTPAPKWYSPPPLSSRGISSTTRSRTSTSTSTRPTTGGILGMGDAAPNPSPSSSPQGVPSLNDAASGTFNTLNNVSSSFFSMLNTTATSFVKGNPSLSPSRGSSRSGSSGRSSWSGGGSSFRSSSSSSSRSSSSSSRGGGGGRSGFG